jgi:hypothetical protein
MFGIDGKRALPWEGFKEYFRLNDEFGHTAIEQKRYEECETAPGPNNEVIVASVLVIWSDNVITTWKRTGK